MIFFNKLKDKYNRKYDMRFILPLFKLGNYLCIVPPNLFESDKNYLSKKYKYFCFVISLLVLSGHIISICGRAVLVYNRIDTSLIVMDLCASFILTGLNIMCNITVVLHFKQYKKIMNGLNGFDNELNTSESNRRYLLLELLLGHIFVITIFAFDAYMWVASYGIEVYKFFIFRDFQYYQSFILGCLIYYIVMSLKFRYQTLNCMLSKSNLNRQFRANIKVNYYTTTTKIFPQLKFVGQEFFTIKKLTRLYQILDEIVDTFNETCGLKLLFLVLVIITTLLQQAAIAVGFNLSSRKDIQTLNFPANVGVLCLFWSGLTIVVAILIASACDKLTSEARCTQKICFCIINRYSTISDNIEERAFREDLILLANQTSSAPYISASGFITINYTFLGFLISNVTTYIIVFIQIIR